MTRLPFHVKYHKIRPKFIVSKQRTGKNIKYGLKMVGFLKLFILTKAIGIDQGGSL